MKPCYFCHLAVSYPWAEIRIPRLNSIFKGGFHFDIEYAHPNCCELAVQWMQTDVETIEPFPSKP
jgi:hypothetical protein